MIGRYGVLGQRVRQELQDIEAVAGRARRYALQAARSTDPEPFLQASALNLHDFYVGLERIFLAIAHEVDGTAPAGAQWPRDLLRQMTLEIQGGRPAVLRLQTASSLEDYLGFRHIVRNGYTSRFKPDRIQELVKSLPSTLSAVQSDLGAFLGWLDRMAHADEGE